MFIFYKQTSFATYIDISWNLCCCKNKFYEDGRIPTEFCTKYTSCAHKFDALHCRSRRYLYAIWHRSKPECDSIWHITKHGQFEALFCCLLCNVCKILIISLTKAGNSNALSRILSLWYLLLALWLIQSDVNQSFISIMMWKIRLVQESL